MWLQKSVVFILDVTPDAGVTRRSINYVDDYSTLKKTPVFKTPLCAWLCAALPANFAWLGQQYVL